MKRVLLGVLGAFLLIAAMSIYVTLSVASDLRAVKETLESDTRELDEVAVAEAETRLRDAASQLGSLPARMLRFVPVIGQNLSSLRDVVGASIPTLRAGLDLKDALDEVDDDGLVDEGRIRLGQLDRMRDPVAFQALTLRDLTRALVERRNGWLAPPLWDAFDSFGRRSRQLLEDAQDIDRFLGVADEILGADGRRTYLVLLMNNAELRGAGGILAGVGALHLDNGRLRLGAFSSVHDLRDKPPREVPAPAEYERRFGVYKANTTLWLNTTFSPDFPDVALVAARLYELKTGTESDGVLVIDPRGVTALLPEDATVDIPGTDVSVEAEAAARFIYSDAYEVFDDQIRRRDAILEFGREAFSLAIEHGLGGEEGLLSLAEAMSGGHIRFTSFHDDEAAVLSSLGVTGELEPEPGTNKVLVTVQNFGGGNSQGTKLDYWARRSIAQSCSIQTEQRTTCRTITRLTNEAPQGLTRYVAGRDGTLRSYFETYLPASAEIEQVALDDDDVEFRVEEQAGLSAVGLYLEVPRGSSKEVEVVYSLPANDDGFKLSVAPQPLARDAELTVDLQLPSNWVSEGAGTLDGDTLRFEARLDQAYLFSAEPDPRTGIAGLWSSFKRFWSRPIF